jgi:hypothetical protein
MPRWEKETVRDRPKPSVLSVGCSHQLLARCHPAAAASGASVREAPDVAVATAFAHECAPLAMIVPAGLAPLQRAAVDALATAVAVEVVTVERDDISARELEDRIYEALVKTARRRGEVTKK